MNHVLLPLKDLVQAKSRLSGLLRPSERRALAQAMVEDVIAVLRNHDDIAGVVLLSDDPVAPLLAEAYNIDYVTEREVGGSGLNGVLTMGMERLQVAESDNTIVLHGDLPALGCGDIDAVLNLLSGGAEWVAGADTAGSGTNLLAFPGRIAPRFQFGENSFDRHTGWAAQNGLKWHGLHRAGIGLDVDAPADLALLLQEEHMGAQTAALMATEIGARVKVSLHSMNLWALSPEGSFESEQ